MDKTVNRLLRRSDVVYFRIIHFINHDEKSENV